MHPDRDQATQETHKLRSNPLCPDFYELHLLAIKWFFIFRERMSNNVWPLCIFSILLGLHLKKASPKIGWTAGWFSAQNDGHEIVGPDDGGANVSFLSPGIPARNPGHDSKRWTNWNEKHMLDIFLDIGGNIFLPNFCVQKFRFWVPKVTADPPKMVAMSRLGVAFSPRIPVTTRIIACLIGNPYKPSFATGILGGGQTQMIGG